MSTRDAITQNFWLKLISLLLATMIWFAISGVQMNTRADRTLLGHSERKLKGVPITVMKSAADLRAFQMEPSTVDLTLSGPTSQVQALTPQQVEVFINLTDVHDTPGLSKKIQVRTPGGIEVVQVSHSEARVTPTNLN